jgi:hypothetical protein
MIPAETQRFMAERMNATLRPHPVDHTPLVTAPTAVVGLLLEAVDHVQLRTQHGHRHQLGISASPARARRG